jgi:hypothetical protein
MARRHDDALFAQLGGGNPLGLSKGLARAFDEVAEDQRRGRISDRSTAALSRDPACQLILHQLCFLAGIGTFDHPREPGGTGTGFNYDIAIAECLRHASPEIVQQYRRSHLGHIVETAPS